MTCGGRDQAVAVFDEVIDGKLALSLLHPPLPQRQHPAQSSIRCPIRRPYEQFWSICQRDARADQQLHPATLGRRVRPHRTGQCMQIRDRDRAIAQLGCRVDQLIRMARPAQEGEVAGHIQLGIVERARRHARRRWQRLTTFWIGSFGHVGSTGFQPVPNDFPHGLETRATRSFEFSMEKPPVRLQHAKDPEPLARCGVFDIEIVACFVMPAPPLAGDALGTDHVSQRMNDAAKVWS